MISLKAELSTGRGKQSGKNEVFMKVRSSIRRMCNKCKIIKRKGVKRVICTDPRHKQRQG